ncbi:hypothetical protein SODALDRAFT_337250 [Sodiomyces alkalinus F11]|uniref:DUF7082 domain-containing protein n=1 Tax=Sodiomyces alkalinus (strain CBS 110278 / VKM F-3762 / F11) TaxID=1314773 RepID=A0A3N2PNJ0_SODAK|nr:hypothetical protein SODALDRAFT_337250 [Sodiomyces alkalinus F11]ROT36101.1 hypothetical protein SODALDRAFT_337250 [Sodiomyces alkalinus F11]
MSAVSKYERASYKAFEPDYHPQRPIIIGEEGLDSPETIAIKYEEAVARANGDLRGASPPEGLLPMSQYGKPQPSPIHGYDTTRDYPEAAYPPYPTQTYSAEQHDGSTQLSAAQLNQEAFAANSALGQYLPLGPSVVSCHPNTGLAGTKVVVKLSSQDDLLTMTSPVPYFYLVFGTNKAPGESVKSSRDHTGCTITFTGEAPDPLTTGYQSQSVPLTVLLEGPDGQEISRTAAGDFLYQDPSVGGRGPGAPPDDITRKASKSPEPTQQAASPRTGTVTTHLGCYDPSTNTYDFATAPSQPAPPPYGSTFGQDTSSGTNNSNMLSAYRTASFADHHYPRAAAPPPLRPPTAGGAWQAGYGRTAGPPITHHTHHTHISISRPSLTPLPMPTPSTPTLVRTTSLQSSPGSSSTQGAGYPSWGSSSYANKAVLNLVGKLDTMAKNWTPEEWTNRRRIVMFNKKQSGSNLTATFRAVNVNERPPNSVCISCIYWAERKECYVTSVDTIYLLEQLVVAPNRFSVEEKNRIRRNLEGFRPQTVSKAKAESEEFFKIIMAFPNPKPRNIEKDVKVFPWKILESALKKIIGKYSASPAASQMLTPAAPVSTYPTLPTPAAATPDPVHAYAAVHPHMQHHQPQQQHHPHHHHQHDGLTSLRSLSGNPHHHWPATSTYPTAAAAAAAARVLSPTMTSASPRQSSLRLAAPLADVSTYNNNNNSNNSSNDNNSTRHGPLIHHSYGGTAGTHSATPLGPQHQHQTQTTTPTTAATTATTTTATGGRWDTGTMPTMHASTSYAEAYHTHTHHGASPPHPPLYGAGGYGDGAQRP